MFFDTAQVLAAPPWLLDVLDTSMRVTVLLVAAAATAFLMRKGPAQARHQVWALALGGALVLPALAMVLPAWHLRVLPAATQAMTESPRELDAVFEPSADGTVTDEHEAMPALAALASTSTHQLPSAHIAQSVIKSALPLSMGVWLLGLWLAGIAVVLARVLFDWVQVWVLSKRATPVLDERSELFAEQQVRLGLTGVALVELEGIELPFTWGVISPTVALPASSRHWSTARLQAAMLHELAHVRRLDALTQLMAWVACAVYWFHPLTWWASRQMRVLREYACDDEVIGQGVRPSSYATELIGIVQALQHEGRESSATLGMARRSPLGARLIALLDPHIPHSTLGRRAVTVLRFGALATLVSTAVVRPAAAQAPAVLPRLAPSESANRRNATVVAAPAPAAAPAAAPVPVAAPTPAAPPAAVVAPAAPSTPASSMTVVSQNGSCGSRRDADELQRIEAIRRDSRDQNDVTRELVELSRDAEFDTETSRQAYLAATASIQSDSLKVEALKGLLRGAPISVETGRGVLAQAKRFTRDDDRAELLSMMHHIRESDLVRGPLVNAYLDIVADLTNQEALSDSLRELLHPREVTAEGVEKALTMLKRVTDPTLRMAVLIEVTDHQRITPSVEAAYSDLSGALKGDLLADAKERLSDAKQQSHRRRSGWFASWDGERRRDLGPEDDAKRREAIERAKEEVKREVMRTRESLRAEEGQIKERARELRQKAKGLSQKYKERAREMQEKLRKEFGNDVQLNDELDLDTE